MDGMSDAGLPAWAWILLAVILFGQALLIYRDATKRGEKAFLWGLFGLMNFPSSLIVYLLVTRIMVKTVACGTCGGRMGADARYCPRCGAERKAGGASGKERPSA